MENQKVFVPFLGDFFSITDVHRYIYVFHFVVFVPFLGDFFSIGMNDVSDRRHWLFSSPFLGTFFQ